MSCDYYLELLSARLDGALTESEERELEAHLESCPACRAAGEQLAALRSAFSELEEIPAPEGFTRDVMSRVRETGKSIPLFRRPRFKALAGLAACAALAVGLYGAVRPPRQGPDLAPGGFSQNALEDRNPSSGEILRSVPDFSGTTAGPDTDTPAGGAEDRQFYEMQKQNDIPDKTTAYYGLDTVSNALMSDAEVLVVDRMPEGGWELIPPETPVSVDGLHVTGELLERIEKMARDQGITASLTSGTEDAKQHLIVVLDETE